MAALEDEPGEHRSQSQLLFEGHKCLQTFVPIHFLNADIFHGISENVDLLLARETKSEAQRICSLTQRSSGIHFHMNLSVQMLRYFQPIVSACLYIMDIYRTVSEN